MIRPLLFMAAILTVALPGLANDLKSAKPAPREKSYPFKIPLWVRNGASQFQDELKPEDLQATTGKAPLKLSSLKPPQSPMLLFVAFDTVGDMANIDTAREALVSEVKGLESYCWVGLLSAQEKISVLQDPTPDRALLEQKIQELSQIGKAGLLESIESVANLSHETLRHSEVRVAVIFVTDSDIGNYHADYLNPPVNASDNRDLSRRFAGRALQEKISRITTALARCQAPIFIVHIDPGNDPLNRTYQNGLKQLAETVGGQLFLSKTVGDIPATLHEAFQWACSFYLVGFELPNPKRGFVKIQLSLTPPGSEATTLHLTYPTRLFVP